MATGSENGSNRKVVISIDLDEWYHSRWITGSQVSIWKDTASFFKEYYKSDRPIGELTEPTRKILDLFDRFEIRATFFVLGEVARYYPELVLEIQKRGHEIACHGLYHFDLFLLSRERFVDELKEAKQILEDLTKETVLGYRAPNLIIEPWVIDVLEDLGFAYDSSVCPSRSFFGKYNGLMTAPQNPYPLARDSLVEVGDRSIFELPIPTFPVLKIPAATGIATRVIGKWWTKMALVSALKSGTASYYFHPYEIGGMPEIMNLSLRTRLFLRRTGPWMEARLRELFEELDVKFISAREAILDLSTANGQAR